MKEWLVENRRGAMVGGGEEELSICGIAAYQPFDGLMKLKVVFSNSYYSSFLYSLL